MQDWLDKLTDLTATQGDESFLKQALADFAHKAGFGGFAYLYIRPGHTIAASNYHPEWRSTYFQRNYEAVDPVVKRSKSLKLAFTWSADQERPRLSKAERAFYAQAIDFGIRSGITVLCRTYRAGKEHGAVLCAFCSADIVRRGFACARLGSDWNARKADVASVRQ